MMNLQKIVIINSEISNSTLVNLVELFKNYKGIKLKKCNNIDN